MHYGDDVHDSMTGGLVYESRHCCVFEVLQPVTQMDALDHCLIIDDNSFLEPNDILEEVPVACGCLNIGVLHCFKVIEGAAEAPDRTSWRGVSNV